MSHTALFPETINALYSSTELWVMYMHTQEYGSAETHTVLSFPYVFDPNVGRHVNAHRHGGTEVENKNNYGLSLKVLVEKSLKRYRNTFLS